jgi:hypothetical protein
MVSEDASCIALSLPYPHHPTEIQYLSYKSRNEGHSASTGDGGGINIDGGNATISSCTFSLNATATGAGISETGSSTVSITDSTFSANFASNQGGGLFHTGSGNADTRNTIIAGNGAAASSPDVMGTVNSQGHNLRQRLHQHRPRWHGG